jgi:hypothetical protein
VGKGTYGCVVAGMTCDASKRPDGVVAKILRSEDALLEQTAMEQLRAADPSGMYSAVLLEACDVPGTAEFDAEAAECIRSKFAMRSATAVRPTLRALTMSNAGKPLLKFLQDLQAATNATLAATDLHLQMDVHVDMYKTVITVFATAVRALVHFHAQGLYHYDLNMGNVVVDGAGVARLIDFGGTTFRDRLLIGCKPEYRRAADGSVVAAEVPKEQYDIYPMLLFAAYLNPFDLMVLFGFKSAANLAANLRTPGRNVEDKHMWFYRLVDYWYCNHVQNLRDVPEVLRRAVVVDDPVAFEAVFDANVAWWTTPGDAKWGAFDVYSLAYSFALATNLPVNRKGASLFPIAKDLAALLVAMVHPQTDKRPTAQQAWLAVQTLCAAHGVVVPPASPSRPDDFSGGGSGSGGGSAGAGARAGAGAGAGAGVVPAAVPAVPAAVRAVAAAVPAVPAAVPAVATAVPAVAAAVPAVAAAVPAVAAAFPAVPAAVPAARAKAASRKRGWPP